MTATGAPTEIYFYLSYAHSVPLASDLVPDTDHWVDLLFTDLSREVRAAARLSGDAEVGFFDKLVSPGTNWKEMLADVLGRAVVFVPLYSPGYLNKSWPLRERQAFVDRVAELGAEPADHLLPVLWVPIPDWGSYEPERGPALEIGSGAPAYAENGLRALCRLLTYRDQYEQVVRRLAARIVDTARSRPLRRSTAMSIDRVDPVTPEPTTMSFVVAVLAPARADLQPGESDPRYGPAPRSWQPYPEEQRFPIADYVANVAERLGLPTRIVDEREDLSVLGTGPAVVLIDPGMAETLRGRAALSVLATALPEWVTPLVVTDAGRAGSEERAAEAIRVLTDRLGAAGSGRVRRVTDVGQLALLLPSLIDDTCRVYLEKAPLPLPKGTEMTPPPWRTER